jgi:hypothetical protein
VIVPILVVCLHGTLWLPDRRSGSVIMLVGSLIALAMPVIHVRAARGDLAKGSGPFLFVCTLHAFGVTSMFTLILIGAGTVEFAGTTKLPKRPTGIRSTFKL